MPSSRSHKFPRCEATKKVRFRTHRDVVSALRGAASVRFRADRDGASCTNRTVRAYECSACRGWHLTSQAVPQFSVSVSGPASAS